MPLDQAGAGEPQEKEREVGEGRAANRGPSVLAAHARPARPQSAEAARKSMPKKIAWSRAGWTH